jgi:hypothetical protein
MVLTRQARSADSDLLPVHQHGIEMPVAGEFPATRADAAAANLVLGITDTTAPLHQDSSNNSKHFKSITTDDTAKSRRF